MAQLPSQSSFGDYAEWPGRDVLDSGGERLGGVREIYLDRETGRPEWVLVDVDGTEARFVPLADASVESATIRVAHPASTVRNAPGIGTEPRIDQSEERRLYAHYGLGYSEDDSGSGLPDDGPPPALEESKAPEAVTTETPAAWRTADASGQSIDDTAPPTAWGAPDESTAGSEPGGTAAFRADENGTAAAPTGLAGPGELSATTPPAAIDADLVPPWRRSEADATTPTSSWSGIEEGSNDAPPPAEPPSPEELEAADIPEPPAATDRAADYETPALQAPADTPALAPPPEPPALEAPTASAPPTGGETATDLPAPLETPISAPTGAGAPATSGETATDAGAPLETPTSGPASHESPSDAVGDVGLGAAPVLPGSGDVPETPPPAAADISAATSFDAPAPPVQPPPWTSASEAQAPNGGALALLTSRRFAMVAATAVVLLMIIRRLR